jgi:hypothetical protein
VLPEFSAESVTLAVLEQLERRRAALVGDPVAVERAVSEALVPIERAYAEAELPRAYYDALSREVRATLPAAWRELSAPFCARERREFGLWRGGDPVARITYVFLGLVIGGLCVELPFIPIWEKWFPFLLAASAWWLPDLQVAWHRRRYSRALGRLAQQVGRIQPALDAAVSTEDLLLPPKGDP